MRLENKICVITGGTSGIGRTTVQRFVQEGAKVVFCGRRKDRGEELLRELAALHYPGEARFYCCDVSKEDEIREMAEFVMREFGPCECCSTMPAHTRPASCMRQHRKTGIVS